jgi:hypothetical protein
MTKREITLSAFTSISQMFISSQCSFPVLRQEKIWNASLTAMQREAMHYFNNYVMNGSLGLGAHRSPGSACIPHPAFARASPKEGGLGLAISMGGAGWMRATRRAWASCGKPRPFNSWYWRSWAMERFVRYNYRKSASSNHKPITSHKWQIFIIRKIYPHHPIKMQGWILTQLKCM